MNAIILSILWGVLMMLGGVFFKKRSTPRYVALVGIILMLLANGFEFFNGPVLRIELHGQLAFSNFGLLVNMVAILCTFLLFLLNGREFEKAGAHVSEYFSLIFFVLCGVAIATSYKSLLLLFLAVELMAVPLYVLVGITKSNLKGTEASLKYFLTGIFFTAIMVFGIALIYGG